MPYRRVEDLPRVQVAPYNDRQKEAFLKAFNLVWAGNGGDEGLAFAAAHDAARRAGGDMSGLAAGLMEPEDGDERSLELEESIMPYRSINDLPEAQVDQYNEHQKEAFLKAFNNAFKEYGGDEHRAFAVAHHAAKQAGERPGPG
jgi:cation transport regulator